MTAGREIGAGLLYGLLSVMLVIGSLSLALSESNVAPPPTLATGPDSAATLIPTSTASPLARATPLPSAMQPPASPTTTSALAPAAPTYPVLHRTAFVPLRPDTFMFSCGPFRGWVRAYVVQPGDNLFQIAVLYHTTVAALERANCTPNSFIYAGEPLWVPYVPIMTEGQTVILMFDTPTEIPSEPPTSTPYDATPTATPTDTGSPTP